MVSSRTWPPRAAMSRLTRREGGREFNESSRSVPNTWQTVRRCSRISVNCRITTKPNVVRLQNPYKQNYKRLYKDHKRLLDRPSDPSGVLFNRSRISLR